MGVYDMYGPQYIQLKVGPRLMQHYDVGDETFIPDGVYIAYEGIVVIICGRVAQTFDHALDKWGGLVNLEQVLDNRNLVVAAIAEMNEVT